MTVGATLFLFLLPLAAAPVVFHLLVRRNRKTVLFSTELFFDSMTPQLSFHRKFREPLLLTTRVLLLLFLLLALARMAFPGMGNILGLGGQQAVVVVIDNSSSMVGRVEGGDRAKLTVALEGARALLKNMDARGHAAVVLLVPDPAAARFGGMTTDKDTLLGFLESIRATEATGDSSKALLRAMALLKDISSGGGGSLHVFSDLQEAEWKATALAADDVAAEVTVFLHRVPSAESEEPNICPLRAELSSRRILPNQPYSLELLLRNDGGRDLQVRVKRNDSEHSVAQVVNVDVGAGAQKLVKLPVQPKTPGRHWVRIWLEGDGFDGDNRIFVPYICEKKGDIYFLGNKAAGAFGLLPLAFSPAGDGRLTSLAPSFFAPTELKSRMQQKTPMLVVLTWATASALDAPTSALLDQYTQQGGNLLVLPAVAAGKSIGKVPAWLGAKREPLILAPVSVPLRVASQRSPFWSDVRGLDGRVRIGMAFAKKYYPLSFENDAGYVPLLSAGDDHVLLALRKHGKGQVVLSGLAFGRTGDWSTLPRQRTFLVMAQPIALGAVASLVNGAVSIVAGQAPRLIPGEGNEMSITTLLGDQVDWSGLRDQSPVLVRGGAYIATVGERDTCLTVLPSEHEGRSAFIEGSEIGALAGIPHQVTTLSDEDDFRDDLEASLAGTGLCLPLLLLALVCLLVEGLLGSPPKKWQDSAKDDSDNKPWVATPAGPGGGTS
ncbi:VWA domain-containing protein [Candidatus Sumerlaeota bacterium]